MRCRRAEAGDPHPKGPAKNGGKLREICGKMHGNSSLFPKNWCFWTDFQFNISFF